MTRDPAGIPLLTSEFASSAPADTGDWQALNLLFNNGYRIQFSRPGQIMYYSPTTAHYYFNPSVTVVGNVYDFFQGAGIGISEPLYLETIDFIQQLFDLEEPSTMEYRQQMEVDFIRIIGRKIVETEPFLSKKEIDQWWAEESERRGSQIEQGEVELIPGNEVFAKIRRKCRR